MALNDDGVAVLNSGSTIRPDALEDINVIAPGPRLVKPEDGEAYLRALPFAFSSPYLYAVFVA